MVTNVLYPCAVLLSQALCDVSRIGALGLSSVLAHFAYGHIHTALFNFQGTVFCGGSYQICRIHYGDSIQITNDSFIPSIGSQQEGSKRARLLKISQRFLQYPSLIQRKKSECWPPQTAIFYSLFTEFVLIAHQGFHIPPQLVAIENALKGQDFWEFLKDFFNTPHLIATGNAIW